MRNGDIGARLVLASRYHARSAHPVEFSTSLHSQRLPYHQFFMSGQNTTILLLLIPRWHGCLNDWSTEGSGCGKVAVIWFSFFGGLRSYMEWRMAVANEQTKKAINCSLLPSFACGRVWWLLRGETAHYHLQLHIRLQRTNITVFSFFHSFTPRAFLFSIPNSYSFQSDSELTNSNVQPLLLNIDIQFQISRCRSAFELSLRNWFPGRLTPHCAELRAFCFAPFYSSFGLPEVNSIKDDWIAFFRLVILWFSSWRSESSWIHSLMQIWKAI